MISASIEPPFESLIERLEAKARTLAEAKAERDVLAARGSPARWRRAALVWPLFAKG